MVESLLSCALRNVLESQWRAHSGLRPLLHSDAGPLRTGTGRACPLDTQQRSYRAGAKIAAKAVRIPLLTASVPLSQACSGSFAVYAWYESTPVAISPASRPAQIRATPIAAAADTSAGTEAIAARPAATSPPIPSPMRSCLPRRGDEGVRRAKRGRDPFLDKGAVS